MTNSAATLLLSIFFTASCCICQFGSYTPGLRIVDLSTGKETAIPSGRFREVILDVSESRRTFCTLERVGTNLVLKQRNNDGHLVSLMQLPLLTTTYANRRWLSISPDRTRAAYFDEKSHDLKLLSLQTNEETVLFASLTRTAVGIALMRWLTPNDLLVLVYEVLEPGKRRSEIIKIKVDTQHSQSWNRLFRDGDLSCALGETRRFLALIEGGPNERVIILDVQDMSVAAIVPPVTSGQTIGSLCWAMDDTQLVFTEMGSGAIYTYDMEGRSVEMLVSGTKKGGTLYVAGAVANQVIYGRNIQGNWAGYEYNVVDLTTKTTQTLESSPNGVVFSLEGGKRVLMEVGY